MALPQARFQPGLRSQPEDLWPAWGGNLASAASPAGPGRRARASIWRRLTARRAASPRRRAPGRAGQALQGLVSRSNPVPGIQKVGIGALDTQIRVHILPARQTCGLPSSAGGSRRRGPAARTGLRFDFSQRSTLARSVMRGSFRRAAATRGRAVRPPRCTRRSSESPGCAAGVRRARSPQSRRTSPQRHPREGERHCPLPPR